MNDKAEPASLLSLAIELRHILQVEQLRDRRGQLASLKNTQLRLEIGFRILVVVVVSSRCIEPGDGSTVLVFDQHARGSAVHRCRGVGAHQNSQHDKQEHRNGERTIFVDRVQAIQQVRIGVDGKESFGRAA